MENFDFSLKQSFRTAGESTVFLFTKASLWMISLLILAFMESLIPESHEYHAQKWFCSLTIQVCIVAASCVLIRGYRAKLRQESWSPSISDLNPAFKALVLSFIYWFFVSLGAFLIIPGIIIAARWCVALLVLVCEKKGPLESLAESNLLSKGKIKLILRYFGIPIVAFLCGPTLLGLAGGLFFTEINTPEAFNSLKWNLSHFQIVAFGATVQYLFLLGLFATLGMQIKLYDYLKHLNEPKPQPID